MSGSFPIQPCQSLRQIPQALTLSTTPVGTGFGVGNLLNNYRAFEFMVNGGSHALSILLCGARNIALDMC